MNQEEVLRRLAAKGGYLKDDHIVMTSGRHTDTYANFRVFFGEGHEDELALFCSALAERFRACSEIDFVVGPQRGGAIIAESVSVLLSGLLKKFVRPVIAFKGEKAEKDFTFYPDDVNFLQGKQGLFVDDVLATGSSLLPVRQRVETHGGRLIAMGFMLNRSGLGASDLGVSTLESLAIINAASVSAEECSSGWLCHQHRPINTTVGHGADYVAKHGQPKAA